MMVVTKDKKDQIQLPVRAAARMMPAVDYSDCWPRRIAFLRQNESRKKLGG
jgi:hypothetical protein